MERAPRNETWERVQAQLLRHAIPDARYHLDFSKFIPNFRGCSSAVGHLANLAVYKSARTILVAPDNSLELLRYQALKDGKKLIVATHGMQRNFVILDPGRISEDKFEQASWLDGMERSRIGRSVTLAQMVEEGIKADLAITGCLAMNKQGRALRTDGLQSVGSDISIFELQWFILRDRGVLETNIPIAVIAHPCQIVEQEDGQEEDEAAPQYDWIVTPEDSRQISPAKKPASGFDFEKRLNPTFVETVVPLQELKGFKMMEQIMSNGGFGSPTKQHEAPKLSAEEQMGVDIIEKLMRGYKP